ETGAAASHDQVAKQIEAPGGSQGQRDIEPPVGADTLKRKGPFRRGGIPPEIGQQGGAEQKKDSRSHAPGDGGLWAIEKHRVGGQGPNGAQRFAPSSQVGDG